MKYKRIARTPLTHIGWGALQELGIEMARFNARRVLLVTDATLVKIGLTKEVVAKA